MDPFSTEAFEAAARDYVALLAKGYPQKSLLKLVGDRYQLSADQRTILYRGLAAPQAVRSRMRKRTQRIRGRRILVDGYNVFYTVSNYLRGRAVFLSNDGYLRDAGEFHSRHPEPAEMDKAVDAVLRYLAAASLEAAYLYLDSPVARSGELAARIREMMLEFGIDGSASTVRSADTSLKEAGTGIIATSDSAIIDASNLPIADLARLVLSARFGLKPFALGRLLR